MAGNHTIGKIFAGLLIAASFCFAQSADTADTTESSQPALDTQAVMPSSGTGEQAVSVALAGRAENPLKNSMSLFFALDEGQAMRGVNNSGAVYAPTERTWQQRMYFQLNNNMTYLERIRFNLSIECQLTFSFLQVNAYPNTLIPLFDFYPNDAEISYTLGDLDRPWLQAAIGYFPYKYNPDVKHLGEYLFRAGAYPTFVPSAFEFAMTRELGLHLYATSDWLIDPAIDRIKCDVMLTSETHAWPTQDWTVSAVLSNNLYNFFDVGVGFSYQRLFSVDTTKTTPTKLSLNRYYDENGDTNYYSFRAIKLMGRATLNPLRFVPEFKIPPGFIFGDNPFFGKEDLKIYAEAAVLGVQNYVAYDSIIVDTLTGQKVWGRAPKVPVNNYGQYYDSLMDRVPYMIGINLPTHPLISYGVLPFVLTKLLKDETGDDITPLAWVTLLPALAGGVCQHFLGWNMGLDILSLEFEYQSVRYPNNNKIPIDFFSGNMPLPSSNFTRRQAVPDPQAWKYALYFKKSFMDQRFAISGLVARDHMRPAFHGPGANGVTDDFLQAKSHWWWNLRLSANF